MLAYCPVQLLRTRLAQTVRTEGWATIRHRLAISVRLTPAVEARNGELIACRQDARPDAVARPRAWIRACFGSRPGWWHRRSREVQVRKSGRNIPLGMNRILLKNNDL